MKILLSCIPVLLIGIAIGVVSGRWEAAGTDMPVLRAGPQEASVAPATGETRPIAVVDNGESFDFGVMEQNTKRSHTFKFRNAGNLPLVLTKGDTTCKCTSFELGDKVIQPGQTSEVTLEWEAKTGEAEFAQSAKIGTNDPDRPEIKLLVVGKVRKAIHTDQTNVVFDHVAADAEATSRVKVYSFLDEKFEITGHEFMRPDTAPNYAVDIAPLSEEELKKEPGAKAGYEVTVTAKPGLPLGQIEQRLQLKHNLESQPPIILPFQGRIVSDISISGPKVDTEKNMIGLGALNRGQGTEIVATLLVKGPHRDETQLQITSVEPANILQAELSEAMHTNPKLVQYKLTVRIPESAEPANFFGTKEGDPVGMIHFTTTHPNVPKFAVKVRFLIKDDVR